MRYSTGKHQNLSGSCWSHMVCSSVVAPIPLWRNRHLCNSGSTRLMRMIHVGYRKTSKTWNSWRGKHAITGKRNQGKIIEDFCLVDEENLWRKCGNLQTAHQEGALLNLALVSFAPFHHVPSNHWTPNSGIHFRLTEGTCHRCWCCTAQDGSYWTGSHCLVPCNRGVHESQADWGHKKNHHLVSVEQITAMGNVFLKLNEANLWKEARDRVKSQMKCLKTNFLVFLSFPLVPGLAMLPYMNLRSPFLTRPLPCHPCCRDAESHSIHK